MPLQAVSSWNKGKRLQVIAACRSPPSCIYKLLLDAHGDLLRGLQVVETAVGITSTLLGEKIEGAYRPDPWFYCTHFTRSQQGHGHGCSKITTRCLRQYCPVQLSRVCISNSGWRIMTETQHDSTLVNSYGRCHRKYPHSEALRA